MKKTSLKHTCIFLALIFLLSSFSEDKSNIHNNKANTLVDFSQVVQYYENINLLINTKPNVNFYASTYGYMLLVEYTGEKREISDEKIEYLGMALKTLNLHKNVRDLFKYEVLVKTGSKKYWFPIQTNLYNYWINELNEKDRALIYIRAYGSFEEAKDNMWLFTINSYNSNYYDELWDVAIESFNNQDEINGINCVEKLIELNPKDGRNYSMYSYYYYNIGYPDNKKMILKADSLCSLAIKLSPKYSYGHYQRAVIKFQLGDYKKAWESIDKAKKLGHEGIENSMIEKLENKLPYSEYIKVKN